LSKPICYIFLCFVFSAFRVFSQSEKADSLFNVLKTSKEDTNKVRVLNAIAFELRNKSDADSCIALSQAALSLAEKLLWEEGVADCYYNLEWFHTLKSDFASGLDYDFKALAIWEKLKKEAPEEKKTFYEIKMARTYAGMGSIYSDQKMYEKALIYFSKAIAVEEKYGRKKSLAVHYGYMGNMYSGQENYPEALKYYKKALEYSEETGNKNVSSYWYYDSGDAYRFQAEREAFSPANKDSLRKSALHYYLKAKGTAEALGNKRLLGSVSGSLGQLYVAMGKPEEGEALLKQSIALSEEMSEFDALQLAEKSLSDLYSESGRVAEAFEHYKRYVNAKDSIDTENNARNQILVETKHEQDKKDLETKNEMQKQKIVRNSFVAGFAFVLLMAMLIFRSYRQKQKANIAISAQKQIIEGKNKDITDSIMYAERIQRSLLTPEKYIERSMKRLRK
jgi:tetratricopeptide (TPR) repeat protein